MAGEKQRLHIELTPEEYETLCAKAKAFRLTKREFIVRLVEGREIRARPSQEIKDLRKEVHQIGNNINQFTRMANACGADARDVRRIQQSMNQVYAMMYRIGSK